MSSEHNFSIGSQQYIWLEKDLQSVDRSVTPWVIFSGHRPMYVNSNYCCEWGESDCDECIHGSDVDVMLTQRANLEHLLLQYEVNLYFAGHFHNMQRHTAIRNGKVVQRAEYMFDEALGEYVHLHRDPKAPVYMVIGSAGNGPTYNSMIYDWSEKFWDNVFGYAMVTALNGTALYWQLIDSSTDEVIDRVVITRGSGDDNGSSSGGRESSSDGDISENTGWTSLSKLEQALVITISTVGAIILLLLAAFFAYRHWKRCSQQHNYSRTNSSKGFSIGSRRRRSKSTSDDDVKLLSSTHGQSQENSTHGPGGSAGPTAEIAMSTMV